MKISIAVPSYNYVQFLDACLESIRTQDFTDYEVLIADGGSNDGSLDIIHHFCEMDDRFKLVSTEDNGQADAISKAFEHASGDILCFLNADDCYLTIDTLTCVVQAFEKHKNIKLLSFGGDYIDATGNVIRAINYRYHPLDGFHLMPYRTAILQPATFWHAEVYNSSEWPKHFNFVFDVVFFYNAYLNYEWLELPKSVAGYRLHGDNKSMSVKSARIKELAEFEVIKFGVKSLRAAYLRRVGCLVEIFEGWGKSGLLLSKGLYYLINSLSYLSCYRLPSI